MIFKKKVLNKFKIRKTVEVCTSDEYFEGCWR